MGGFASDMATSAIKPMTILYYVDTLVKRNIQAREPTSGSSPRREKGVRCQGPEKELKGKAYEIKGGQVYPLTFILHPFLLPLASDT